MGVAGSSTATLHTPHGPGAQCALASSDAGRTSSTTSHSLPPPSWCTNEWLAHMFISYISKIELVSYWYIFMQCSIPCGSFFNLRVRTRAPSIRGLHGSHSPSEQSSRTTHTLVVPMLATDVPQYLIIIKKNTYCKMCNHLMYTCLSTLMLNERLLP